MALLTKKEFTKKLGERLKELREQKGVSQEELADLAGFYRTYIGHIENARYSPSAYVLYKIAEALKIDLSELLDLK